MMRTSRVLLSFLAYLSLLAIAVHADDASGERSQTTRYYLVAPRTEAPSLLDLVDFEKILSRLDGRTERPPRVIKVTSTGTIIDPAEPQPSLLDLVDVDRIVGGITSARHPTADELIALAPNITSTDPVCRSIEISGFFQHDDHVRLTFRALYRAPDRFALILRDDPDGPPVLYAVNRKLLVYDPVRPVILYSEKARFEFSIAARDGSMKLEWWFWPNSTASSRIDFNIRSILNMSTAHPGFARNTVTRRNDGTYVLSSEFEDGDSLRFGFDLTRRFPCKDFGIFADGNPHYLSVDRIVVNGSLNDSEFVFPTREALAEGMNVRPCAEDGLLKQLGDVGLSLRGMFARVAVHNPEMRATIKFPGLVGIDWDQVEENDRKYSKLLREAIANAKP